MPTGGQIIWQRKKDADDYATISGSGVNIKLDDTELAGKYTYRAKFATGNDSYKTSGDLFVISVILNEVSFGNNHTIKEDSGSDCTAPHYYDGNLDGDANDSVDKKHPICFTRDTTMKASVKWRIEPADAPSIFLITGTGPGNLDFPTISKSVSGNDLTVNDFLCSTSFDPEIDIMEPMTIKWSLSLDGGFNWLDTYSHNDTYVTLGDPVSGCTLYHTSVYIGCKKADGINDEDALINAIWPTFSGRNVKRFDGTPLKYYESSNYPYTTPEYGLSDLLLFSNGRCNAFQELLINIFKVQGSDKATKEKFDDTKPYLSEAVNYYKTTHNNHTPEEDGYPNDSDHRGNIFYIKKWNLTAGTANPTDLQGCEAQNKDNPIAIFENHALVKINNKIYDPSYGGDPYDNIDAWKAGNIVGYGAQFMKVNELASDFYLYVGETN
jgi:hypothetical protein